MVSVIWLTLRPTCSVRLSLGSERHRYASAWPDVWLDGAFLFWWNHRRGMNQTEPRWGNGAEWRGKGYLNLSRKTKLLAAKRHKEISYSMLGWPILGWLRPHMVIPGPQTHKKPTAANIPLNQYGWWVVNERSLVVRPFTPPHFLEQNNWDRYRKRRDTANRRSSSRVLTLV